MCFLWSHLNECYFCISLHTSSNHSGVSCPPFSSTYMQRHLINIRIVCDIGHTFSLIYSAFFAAAAAVAVVVSPMSCKVVTLSRARTQSPTSITGLIGYAPAIPPRPHWLHRTVCVNEHTKYFIDAFLYTFLSHVEWACHCFVWWFEEMEHTAHSLCHYYYHYCRWHLDIFVVFVVFVERTQCTCNLRNFLCLLIIKHQK